VKRRSPLENRVQVLYALPVDAIHPVSNGFEVFQLLDCDDDGGELVSRYAAVVEEQFLELILQERDCFCETATVTDA